MGGCGVKTPAQMSRYGRVDPGHVSGRVKALNLLDLICRKSFVGLAGEVSFVFLMQEGLGGAWRTYVTGTSSHGITTLRLRHLEMAGVHDKPTVGEVEKYWDKRNWKLRRSKVDGCE
ncbi:hypothetical protein RRG08_060442 [Elysia crispata]|uniref:Uncharacterized protein n=1 Tax=Elysia crispata TaxID=231223 RepID=A0AAE1AL01_9GAST|nr:hypothetical protein RRG08_060442 [Elysia crispata]